MVSVGSLIGALATARRKTIDVRDVVSCSAVGFGVGHGCCWPSSPNQPSAFAVGLLVGLGQHRLHDGVDGHRADRGPTPSMRGRVLALQAMVFLGSTPIGGPIVGAISQRFGARYSILIGAVAALAAGSYGMATVRARARRPGHDGDELENELATLAVNELPALVDPLITPRAS